MSPPSSSPSPFSQAVPILLTIVTHEQIIQEMVTQKQTGSTADPREWNFPFSTGLNQELGAPSIIIDTVTRIGSRAPIVIVDFATAHPSDRFLCRIPALLTEGVG